ncbi:MAG: hypothetical protein GF313_04175 [Caldithrix sp.]|nr:hypothetical protein [Caldithrix sp.]
MKWLILTWFIFVYMNPLSAQPDQRNPEKAEECGVCHEEIFQQWQTSMHHSSTADKDILYKKMMAWAVEDTKGKAKKMCRQCHYPYAMFESPVVSQTVANERSIDCAYCHSIDQIDMPSVFTKTKYSRNNNTQSEYHTIEAREHFTNNELCFKCHDVLTNPNKVHICITGMEYDTQNKRQSCNHCHMPQLPASNADNKDGGYLASHQFAGPHNADFIKGSLGLKYVLDKDSLIITVDNSATPHAYPTGSPLRQVILKVEGFNKNEQKVFQNWQENPFKEAPEALFVRLFAGKDGNFPVPPWRAVEVERDTRLKAGKKRQVTYSIPVNTHSINLQLLFRLAPVTILNKLNIDDPYLRKAHLIRQVDIII